MNEPSNTVLQLPKIDVLASKEAMDYIGTIAAKTKNRNLEDDDWEELIDKLGWTVYQHTLFSKVADILCLDRLARLTNTGHPNEAVLRRASIDKAVQRLRKAFAVIHWDIKLTQWMHGLLVDHLPVSDITAYIDILQTLRAKVPTLVDKMVLGRSNELLEAVVRPPWEPVIEPKERKITPEPVILVVPSVIPGSAAREARVSSWMTLLATMSSHVRQIELPEQFTGENKWPLTEYMERLVTLIRTKLHDIRKEFPQRSIILVGFNTGSALALQVASLEQNISCVLCLGFSTSTMRGTRGTLDDRLVDLQTPVLFVIGQNAARTSQEQIEALREQMIAPTALVVVGSADDSLQVTHAKRRLENVTQPMVDCMVMDEVAEFTSNCISNPPSPTKRKPVSHATIVILDSPTDKHKGSTLNNGGSTAATVRKQKPPVKGGRVTKKKLMERIGMASKMSPPKKEYAEKVALTSSGGTTSYEIVTGKIKQDVGMRQLVDGGFIQIANGSNVGTTKWQAAQRTTVRLPAVVQKQKISLGNHFTPMRTAASGEHVVINSKAAAAANNSFLAKDVYTINAKGKKTFSLQTADVMETIELDTDEEILNIDGDTILDAQVVDASSFVEGSGSGVQLAADDISAYPVVFQDSEGNIQEPAGDGHVQVGETILISSSGAITSTLPPSSSGSVVVTSSQQSGIPRPNKFIYYKPQQTMHSKQTPQTQYVVLSSNAEEKRVMNTNAPTASKPLIISVESLEKGAPNTVYHVVEDSEKEE